MMIRKTFKKHEVQTEFEENGFVVFKNAIPDEKIKELRAFYHKDQATLSNPRLGIPIDTSFSTEKSEVKQMVASKIDSQLLDFVSEHLDDYKTANQNVFIVKHSKSDIFKYHYHPILVDIDRFRAVSIWFPLQDVDEHNGTLCLGKNKYHGLELTDLQMCTNMSDTDFKKETVAMNLKKGDLVVFDNMLKHGSYSNLSDNSRFAIVAVYIPNEADFYHYQSRHTENGSFVDVYESSYLAENLYNVEGIQNEIKNLTPIRTIPYPKQHIAKSIPNRSVFSKIKGFFTR
jgi:ectoine hydroxylase-related dioxygenase (phytanoyl-CoA dioxygenase family)